MPADPPPRRFVLVFVAAVCLLSPLAHLLSLGPLVPEGTFFLISRLHGSLAAGDPSNLVHAFARPPVFALMGWVFSYPLAYLVMGYVAHVAMHGVLCWLALIGIRSVRTRLSLEHEWLLSGLLVVLVFPLLHLLRLDDRGISLVPHDSVHAFSHRTLFWSVMAVSFGCLLRGRERLAIWLTALGAAVHPSAGILAFFLMVPLVGVPILGRRDTTGALHVAGALGAGALPTLVNKVAIELPPELTRQVTFGDWYSSMIKDEADDFSFLYQLVYQPKMCGLVLLVVVVGLVVYARSVPDYRKRVAFWAALVPLVLFFIGTAMELVFAVFSPTPLILFSVALTPGYRLASYAFFPLFVLGAELLALAISLALTRFADRGRARGAVAAIGIAAVTVLAWLAMGVASGQASAFGRYARWALGSGRVDGIDAYFLGLGSSASEHFAKPRLYQARGPFVTYPGERNLLAIRKKDRGQPHGARDEEALRRLTPETFAEICALIRARVEPGAGLFIPPYLRHFRDALVDRGLFLQEHHDGNLMLGAPAFLGFFAERMRDLLGFDYEGMPSKHTGLNFTAMRNAYLTIDDEKARGLLERYPRYPYFVSEAPHTLGFRVVGRNAAFVVYDLRAPASGGR